jgi:enoyl-CoA hydratase
MTWQTMTLTLEGPIAHVQLCRAAELNTMTPAFWTEIIEVFAAIDADPAIRAVILSSTGKHFSAGLDLAGAGDLLADGSGDPGRHREQLRRKIKALQESFSVIDRCRVPVIAVIQGGCIGGGVDMVTACDMRIGTADCFLTVQEINIGIVADVGTLQRLPHLLPQGLVRELCYTGRRMAADEALRWGLLNSVAPDAHSALGAARDLAKTITSKSPLAMTGIKTVLNAGRDQSIAESLDYVATWNAGMLISVDVAAAIEAQQARRDGDFSNLLA